MKPANSEKLYVVPCSKEQAGDYIHHMHRHHDKLDFASFCLAVCTSDGNVHGVALVGRTATQHMKLPGISNRWIAEVRRVATDGFPNACSALYGAAWRFAREMGYRAIISYTLPSEGGASLRALGWECIEDVGGNSWAHRSKSGIDIHPTVKKSRWQCTIASNKIPPFEEINWPTFTNRIQKGLFSEEGETVTGDGVGNMLDTVFFQETFSDEFFKTNENVK